MQRFRTRRRSIAALAASMFLAVWASMAVAPCLMAAEALAGGDCPHCPEPPPPCHDPAGTTACTYVDGYDFDGRTPAVPKVEVDLVAMPALDLATAALPLPRAPQGSRAARAPPHPGGPRLHLRHCVLND